MTGKKRILIVEDESKIARFIQLELEHAGYETGTEADGNVALGRLIQEQWDLALLDVMLPGMFGTEICRRLRQVSQLPVIMLTARGDIDDRVQGLDLGADDYIVKPFDMRELLARIRAVLRKFNHEDGSGTVIERLELRGLVLEPARYEAGFNGELLQFTKREFDLMEYLLRNQGIVLSRDKILAAVWEDDFDGGDNVVDVYIRYLRSKLEKAGAGEYIKTVRGAGYMLE